MTKTGLWAIAGVAVVTLLFLVYLAATFEPPAGTSTVVLPAPASVSQPDLPQTQLPAVVVPPVVTAAEPAVVQAPPVEVVVEPVVAADPAQLPSLNDSDGFVLEGLRALQNGVALIGVIADTQLVRKFVVLVENVSRGGFPQTEMPYRSITEEMPVTSIDDNLFVMDASAQARFDQVIELFVAIDTDQAMTLYRMLSPLFQQAYAEIGFRDENFDDTLRRALTNVISKADVAGPYQLVKPSVMYLYADASIENLQAIHKQLIRLGPDNSDKLKAKLRQFLMQL